jgi:N-methylhydantoinase A
MRIGIDVGGTFTDFLLTHDDGTSRVYKVLSTPDDPSVATLRGIEEMARDRGLEPAAFLEGVEVIVHGTTVTTNAVLTRGGARTGLLTTAGVRDALEMRRGIREEQYNNRFENVRPLAERYLRFPIRERLDWAGGVVTPIETADVEAACDLFAREGVEAVAICFMNSFANPEHERRAAAIVRERLPQLYLTVSGEFLPSIRFYDRLSTTVLNSYVGPILKRYLDALLEKLAALSYRGVLLIMASNGGVVAPEVAKDNAAITLLSGPAGGPVAGVWYTAEQGFDDCITADMGGTSFDAALVKNRTPFVTTVGEIDRLRIALPMLNVVTIGAGGGSIGWIDEGGLLRMGPQSAGAKPGPVCYGLGGDRPTCTDADLVLGYLDPGFFAGGRIRLDADAALRAIERRIAGPLGLGVHQAAAGMYDLINTNMAAAVREVAVKQGQDPRDFPLVIAGGAGPNHACRIALELEIPLIVVPRESSIFCAAGMLMSDLKHSFVKTYATPLHEADPARFRALFEEMRRAGERMLAAEGFEPGRARLVHSLDLRYVNQYHEVEVEIPAAAVESCDFDAIARLFHPVHNRLFGYSLEDEGAPVELINMRLVHVGVTDKPRFSPMEPAGPDPAPAFKGLRRAWLPGQRDFAEIPVYDGFALACGNRIAGPAIIEQVNTTTFVTPEFRVLVDRYGSYTIYLPEREDEVARRAGR